MATKATSAAEKAPPTKVAPPLDVQSQNAARKPGAFSNSIAAAERKLASVGPTNEVAPVSSNAVREQTEQAKKQAPTKKRGDGREGEAKTARVGRAPAAREAAAPGKRPSERKDESERAPAELDTSSEASVLASLAITPASKLGESLDNAVDAAPAMHAKEKHELDASMPEIDRPSGIPRAPKKQAAREAIAPTGKAEELPAPGPRQTPELVVSHPEPRAELPAAATPVPEEEPEDSGDGSWWSGLWSRMQDFFKRLPTTDPDVSTYAGPRPNVDQTGDANPAQCREAEGKVVGQVTEQRTLADAATHADFGENDIYPNVPEERMRPHVKLRPVDAPKGRVGPPPGDLPPEAQHAFDQALAPKVAADVGKQMDEHARACAEQEAQNADVRAEGKRQLDEATLEARNRQLEARGEAKKEVSEAVTSWQGENAKVVSSTSAELQKKRLDHEKQVDETVKQHESDADKKLDDAEKESEEKKKKAQEEAEEIKRREEARPKSWWERAKGAIKSVFNKIKGLVNAVFNKLRSLVKGIIEAAKAVVKGIIELGRRLVVGLIKTFGAIAKGLLTLALIAFPETARKARAWIDDKVDVATKAVNDAADWLKKKADAVLDWVGGMLDKILAFVQTLYNLYLDVLCMLATGEIWTLWKKVRDLGEAAKIGTTEHLEGEIWKELLGFDLTKDLGPQLAAEEAKDGGAPTPSPDSQEAQAGNPENLEFLLQDKIRDDQVAVEPPLVEEVDAGFTPANPGAGELVLASFADPERSGDAAKEELMSSLPQTSVPTSEEKEAHEKAVEDPEMGPVMQKIMNAHTRAERFDAVKDLMAAGLKRFWREKLKPNLWWIIPALIVAIAAVVLSGGAALAAIFEAVAVLFVAYDISKVMAGLGEYLEQGWKGNVGAAAIGFAKGIAAGVVAALMFFLFEVGGRAIKLAFKGALKAARAGVGAAKAIGKAAVRVGVAAGKGIVRGVLAIGRFAVRVGHIVAEIFPRSARFVLRKGRMIFKGLERGAARAARSLESFTKRIKDWFHRFKGFVAEPRSGGWIDIYGLLNPKVYIGSIKLGGRVLEGQAGGEELERALKAIDESGTSLDDASRAEFQRLAEDLRKALDSNTFSGNLKKALEGEIEKLLLTFKGQHVESNPILKEAWERVLADLEKRLGKPISSLTDDELRELYPTARGMLNDALPGVIRDVKGAVKGLEDVVHGVPPNVQVHHLLYKSLFPGLSLDTKNLIFALRKVSGGADELHDLLHLLSSAGVNRFRVLTDEAAVIITKVFL